MRVPIKNQKVLGSNDIAKIEFNLRCRDEMPRLLLGLQYIYCNPSLRNEVFGILNELIPAGINRDNGRPGMDLWSILVLGCVRLDNNCDYDKVHDLANNHKKLREMLGHGTFDDTYEYSLQRLKDNLSLFAPEILDRINQVVVKAGHSLIYQKKNEKIELKGKCDSFVLETNVHYPTDVNLLFDAIRKVITLISRLCGKVGICGWRKSAYNLKTLKRLLRKIQKMKRSTSKDEKKQATMAEKIKQAHLDYVMIVESFLERTEASLDELNELNEIETPDLLGTVTATVTVSEIKRFVAHAYRQIAQTRRRVSFEQTIPHKEKVFSVFEEHTEWINKGKAGVPQELGLRISVVEDQHRFILHHRVMEKETDDMVAVPMVEEIQERFDNFVSCSFDKGYYAPENKEELDELLEVSILPKKGRLSQADKECEYSQAFVEGRRQHSAVESAINALENHGLDRCYDHGITGFKRYVGLAVLSRNIHILGNLIHERKKKELEKHEKRKAQGRGTQIQVLKVA
ncbi:MAG: ISNCY family transposase [bacterium]|nr:ISNCY family transposase [bacterium]